MTRGGHVSRGIGEGYISLTKKGWKVNHENRGVGGRERKVGAGCWGRVSSHTFGGLKWGRAIPRKKRKERR